MDHSRGIDHASASTFSGDGLSTFIVSPKVSSATPADDYQSNTSSAKESTGKKVLPGKPGYEYLAAYKLTVVIEDLTIEFCRRCKSRDFPDYPDLPSYRSHDQWIQAARSGTRNIPEGYLQQGKKGYIKLGGVSRGSLEELLKDVIAYARQHRISIWPKEKTRAIRGIGGIKEIDRIWEIIRATPVLPDQPNFPDLPDDPEVAVNMMISLINQANYLIDRLVASIKEKHAKEGGLTEELYRKRKEYRGY